MKKEMEKGNRSDELQETEPEDLKPEAAMMEEDEDAEDIWEDEDDVRDDWEDEEPLKPWKMALVFAGLVVAAAVICIVLWNFTHRDKTEDMPQDTLVEQTEAPGENAQVPAEVSMAAGTVTPVADATAAPAADSAPVPVQTSEPAAAATTAPTTVPENADATAAPKATDAPVSPEVTKAPTQAEDTNRVVTQDGRTIIFTDCDDTISPKEYVNLRTEPSTSQGNDTVSCRLNYGETAHRTGYSEDTGWSRVEYDGKVLYVVSSYIYVVEEQTTE